jgi:hypothetical protein
VTIRGNSCRRRQPTDLWQTLHAPQNPDPAPTRRRRARQEGATISGSCPRRSVGFSTGETVGFWTGVDNAVDPGILTTRVSVQQVRVPADRSERELLNEAVPGCEEACCPPFDRHVRSRRDSRARATRSGPSRFHKKLLDTFSLARRH